MSPAENVDVFLNRYEAAFTDAFRLVLASKLPADTAYGLIWFQPDDTTDVLPLTLFWCDGQHGCAVPESVTLHVATNQPLWPTGDIDDTALGTLVFQWVRRCWQTAGGHASSVPFYVYNYCTGEHFSLQRGCYVHQQSDLIAPSNV